MRVLILSPETPSFPGTGGQSRQYSLLEPLARRHEIRVLSTGRTLPFGHRPANVEVRELSLGQPYTPPPGWLRRNLVHALREPPRLRLLQLHECATLAAALPAELEAFRPDLVQAEHGQLARLLDLVPATTARVLVLANMLTALQAQAIRTGNARHLAGDLLELLLAAREERRDIGRADVVVTVSARDRNLAMRLRPGGRVRVVPNCVPRARWRTNLEPSPEPLMAMSASFQWPPNEAAATFLLTSVLPAVRRRVPTAELVLVGQGVSPALAAMTEATPGARLTGPVDDVREELRRAWVFVAPLRGSGSPLKVMEAMTMGLPVVTTRRVARALEMSPGDGIAVAADLREFAPLVVELMEDAGRRTSMSLRAAALAERFDAEPAARLQEQVWQEALAVAAGRGGGGPA